ncbi:MAG: hypothetical protein KC656_12485, partial [Myxococcales bacterium]|nr:hypothetical protein [Myxococcales bacterium]
MLLHLALLAHAADRQVPSAYPTVQAAVDASNPGDTIVIAAGQHTGSIYVSIDLTITGAGSAVTRLRRAVYDEVLFVAPGATLNLVGVTLDGQAGRGAKIEGSLVGSDVVIDRVAAPWPWDTSGISLLVDGGSADLTAVRMATQVSGSNGAHVAVYGGSLVLDTCEVGNASVGQYGMVGAEDSALTLRDCFVHTASSGFSYGVGLSADGSDVVVEDSVFEGFAQSGGVGGAIAVSGGSAQISDTQFLHAFGADDGGLVYIEDADVGIRDSSFEGGFAHDGGGLYLLRTSGIVQRTRFDDNEAEDDGGAAVIEDSDDMAVVQSLFCSNRGSDESGGIYWDDGGTATRAVVSSLFAYNQSNFGAALSIGNGSLGDMTVLNNHFVGNLSGEGGAVDIWGGDAAGAALVDNLFLENTAAIGVDAPNANISYNAYFLNGADFPWDGGAGTGAVFADPLLRDRTRGCDPVSMVPMPGSPLIDAGDPSHQDPDLSRADIGAFGGPGAPDLTLDADSDTHPAGEDCDDYAPTVFPGAPEACDGLDNDCDA